LNEQRLGRVIGKPEVALARLRSRCSFKRT
jgi:hypothetical protein